VGECKPLLKGLDERVPGSAEDRAGSVGTAATFASAVRSADAAEARVATACRVQAGRACCADSGRRWRGWVFACVRDGEGRETEGC